jgi:hypothetical protein
MAYYASPDKRCELYTLTDPHAAISFANTDSVDLNLIVLRRYFQLQVLDFDNFANNHREFLLVSGGAGCLPARLLHEGDTLQLLSTDGNTELFKVTLR